ncbi:unnamed protein product [Rhizoctonia solani]|uniref:Peptidase S8/S53 domain-containing protein n=1 Tax=Rhizoctonia solani TaxID=456999 RepID=A0A8H3HLT6_9AGAM|nr:unnamed protein product [Rhizoctonia solani]
MQQIEYIEQDSILSLAEHEAGIDHDISLPTFAGHEALTVRTGVSVGRGEGVSVYGIDTGIYIDHECFRGRALFGASFVDETDGESDKNGHGTHTAATAVGEVYGLATASNIIAVKVLDGSGSGATSGVIQGVCWVSKHFKDNGMKPSIATMSLGGPPSPALNHVVKSAINLGIHFTVAAGNSNQPADTSSPANVEAANTIGAVDKGNNKAEFSNYGQLIDVWALGVDVKSAWIGSPDAENTISGTSMATPHVAGILAVAISNHGNKSPKELSDDLKAHAKPVVTGAILSNNLLATKW